MAFTPTPHPVLKVPSKKRMLEFKKRGEKGLDELADLLKKREELIRLEKNDPYRCYVNSVYHCVRADLGLQ